MCMRFLMQFMIRTLSLILLAFRSLRHTSMIRIAPPGMTSMPMVLPSNPAAAVPNSFGITAGTCGISHMGNPHCPNWFCTRGMDIILLSVRECSSDITMPLHSHSLLLSPFRRIVQMIQHWFQMTRMMALFLAIWWKTTPWNGTRLLRKLPLHLLHYHAREE